MELTWISYMIDDLSYFHDAKFVMNGSQILAKRAGYLFLFDSTTGGLLNSYNLLNGNSVFGQNIYESTYQGS